MAKVDKIALVRLALKHTLESLDAKEKLCVLADLYAPPADKNQPRWYGNGNGTSGLEQGVYNYMTTFRRVSSLWGKVMALTTDIKQETYMVRDILVQSLNDQKVSLPQEPEVNE